MADNFDQKDFRAALGRFATGVVVVTAILDDKPEGMTIGSFTSASLAPPLVAFFPGKNSGTWPRIRQAGRFCVNILAESQRDLCNAFARGAQDKFNGVAWQASAHGNPHLDGALAWLDCDLGDVFDAGDHHIALGRVQAIKLGAEAPPLLHYRSSYPVLSPDPHSR